MTDQVNVDVSALIAHYRQQLADANERLVIAGATADTIRGMLETKEEELASAKVRIAELEASALAAAE